MSRRVRIVLTICLAGLPIGCATSPVPATASSVAPVVREGFADAGESVRIFYRVVGSGADTVIVIHGGPGLTMDYFAADLEPLAARGYTLVFYDQRGAGRSSLVADSAGLRADNFAADLEALRRHLATERLTLLGHSWGAAVLALYAARHPDRVERLLIVGGIPPQRADLTVAFRAMAARRDSVARRTLRTAWEAVLADPGDVSKCRRYYKLWFIPFYADSTAAARTRGEFCAGTPESLRNGVVNVGRYTAASLGEWDWRATLRTVVAPALVIHGTADPLPLKGAQEWAAGLPNGRLLLLEGIGHFPYEEAPGQFFAAVDAFLQGRWPDGARAVAVPSQQ